MCPKDEALSVHKGIAMHFLWCELAPKHRIITEKKFLTQRVVRHWHRLPSEAVDAPSLEVLKARLDGALGNLVWWEVFLPTAGGLDLDDL